MDNQFQRMSFSPMDNQSQRNLVLHSLFLDSKNVPPTVPVQHFVEWLFTLQNSKLVAVDPRHYPTFLFLGFLHAPDAQMFITRELTWNGRSLPIKLAHKDMDTALSTCIIWNPRWSWKSMCHSLTCAPQAEFTSSIKAQAEFSSSASASPAEFSSSPKVVSPYDPIKKQLQDENKQLRSQLQAYDSIKKQMQDENAQLRSQLQAYEQQRYNRVCHHNQHLMKLIMKHATALLTDMTTESK